MTRVFHRGPSGDAPPAQPLRGEHEGERRPAQPREEGPVRERDLGDARDEQAGVQGDHRGEVAPPVLAPTARQGPAGVARRHDELHEPLEPGGQDERRVQHEAHAASLRAGRPPQRDELRAHPRTEREEHPQPAGWWPAARVSASTWSTDADERLPAAGEARARDRQLVGGQAEGACTASRIFGPPGCTSQDVTSSGTSPCAVRSALTSSATCAPTASGSPPDRTIRSPEAPTCHPSASPVAG